MIRRLLLVAGGGGEDVGPLPPDPTLTEPRTITQPFGINQNVRAVATTGGYTIQYDPVTILEDSADLRLSFHGGSQGGISDPMTLKVAARKGSGAWRQVLFDGTSTGLVPLDGATTSDALPGPFFQGEQITLRVYVPNGQTVNLGHAGTLMSGGDYTLTTTWAPTSEFPETGPFPLVILGSSRASVIAPGLYGDSIAAQGLWWSTACAANDLPGVNYGRNVQRFTGRWLDDAVEGITHMLVQFGVNDLSDSIDVATMWARAVACYAYIDSLRPDLPLWQTTPTPIVDDTANNQCATLAGQTVRPYAATYRPPWVAFLRDGAPCHPSTKAALAVGATGTVIRAGHADHPLRGIVDIAAAVEQGGSSSPSGKWRVDLGPLGGDGVHPTAAGELAMAPPVTDWMSTLTI